MVSFSRFVLLSSAATLAAGSQLSEEELHILLQNGADAGNTKGAFDMAADAAKVAADAAKAKATPGAGGQTAAKLAAAAVA